MQGPALFPKAQNHLLQTAHLFSRARNILSQLLQLLDSFFQQSKRVPADTGKADLVRGARPLPEPPSLEMSRDTGARAPFSFPALQVLPFPSSFSKRQRERERHEPWALHNGSANSPSTAPTTPAKELQARRGLLPYRLQLARRLLLQHLKGKGTTLESQSCWSLAEPAALGRHRRSCCCCFFGSRPGDGGFTQPPSAVLLCRTFLSHNGH